MTHNTDAVGLSSNMDQGNLLSFLHLITMQYEIRPLVWKQSRHPLFHGTVYRAETPFGTYEIQSAGYRTDMHDRQIKSPGWWYEDGDARNPGGLSEARTVSVCKGLCEIDWRSKLTPALIETR